ncbi:MAG: sugar transferase [Planctomycetota bacterium]|nr:sugar transferase [Planctomycetota bacterium]
MPPNTTDSSIYAANFAAGLKIPEVAEPHLAYNFSVRVLDIFSSLLFLSLAWPVMLLAAMMIKLSSRGKVLFRHRRLGYLGYPFYCYKFRTMHEGAGKLQSQMRKELHLQGPRVKLKNDPRITAIGRFLRRFSIDEFPQMINVLQGHMSLVGPRPLPIEELEDCTPLQLERLAVKPGLTCIWQVSGRSEIELEGQIEMDLQYIQKRSLALDLKILSKTPWVVLGGRGAY